MIMVSGKITRVFIILFSDRKIDQISKNVLPSDRLPSDGKMTRF